MSDCRVVPFHLGGGSVGHIGVPHPHNSVEPTCHWCTRDTGNTVSMPVYSVKSFRSALYIFVLHLHAATPALAGPLFVKANAKAPFLYALNAVPHLLTNEIPFRCIIEAEDPLF